jgi:hypothetical protein
MPEDKSIITPESTTSAGSSPALDEEYVWDAIRPFTLTVEPMPTFFTLSHLNGLLDQDTMEIEDVSEYLVQFPTTLVTQEIKNEAQTTMDPLFFAVAANRLDAVELLINYGANVNARHTGQCFAALPLLAFAIIRGNNESRDTTEVVRTLLAHGADPSVIGLELFSTFEGPDKGATDYCPRIGKQAWCTVSLWEGLRVTLNITQKYLLNKAVKLPVHSARRKQVATEFHYERLFQVPFKLIGQDSAVQEVTTAILTHSLLGGRKPLILVFAGAL